MLLEDVLNRVLSSEELEYADCATVLTSKEMTTVCKDNLTALLDGDLLVL